MSDSTDNTNELDSYGVWVKNTPQDQNTDSELDFADSLDLPEFDENAVIEEDNFSDIFEENSISEEIPADDTTLTDDELLNITSGEGIEIAEVTEEAEANSIDEVDFNESIEDDVSLDESNFSDITEIGDINDLSIPDFDANETPSEESALDNFTEEPAATDSSDDLLIPDVDIEDPSLKDNDDTSIEDFNFDEAISSEEEKTEEPAVIEEESPSFDIPENTEVSDFDIPSTDDVSTETEVPDFDIPSTDDASTQDVSETFDIPSDAASGEDEEISLDDFMDSGFSDESVASGNNGFAPDAVPSAGGTEEVSLDDFVDLSEFGVSEEAPKKEEAIEDEKPLDMDISFDSSADLIQTEENINNNEVFDDDDYEAETTDNEETATETAETSSSSEGNDIDAEEVDLSDFGIDVDAEETPVTQDVEGAKNKEVIVDYDLSVNDDNMAAAPVVNEIKSDSNSDSNGFAAAAVGAAVVGAAAIAAANESYEEAEPVSDDLSTVDSSLLQQIVADLSSLKDEINALKTNLEEIKSAPAPVVPAEEENIITEENAIDDDIIPMDNSNEGGFFGTDDGDDTISLSTDELSNILNTADFNETTEESVEADTAAFEETPAEPSIEVTEETPAEEPASEEVVLDETPSEFITSDSTEDIPSEINNITDETFEATNEAPDDLSFDFNKDENLSEPNLDDIEISEEDFDDDLPEEITISKDEDILVESSSSDFMDSVQDSTENYQTEEAMAVEENVIDEATDSFAVDTPTETFESDNFSTVDNVFEEEPSIEETPVEEPETPAEDDMFVNTDSFDDADKTLDETTFDETLVEDPVDSIETEETAVSMDEVEPQPQHESNFAYNDFVSHEEENNRLTDSNIDYLTTEEKEAAQPEENSNAELKKDIKSVLLYMDQLLENLPEEKIVEFAKSEEFTTYKKLFSELGLS